jgi:hypothetical protein
VHGLPYTIFVVAWPINREKAESLTMAKRIAGTHDEAGVSRKCVGS